MVNEPTPHPREIIISELEILKKQFLAAGNCIQQIPAGLSGENQKKAAPSPYQKLQQSQRAKLAPEMRKHVEAGMSIRASANSLGIRLERVLLIAKENGIVYPE
ncbi:hypothetical protein D3C84_561500 [compost metagenome]|jgi:hypothetical protein